MISERDSISALSTPNARMGGSSRRFFRSSSTLYIDTDDHLISSICLLRLASERLRRTFAWTVSCARRGEVGTKAMLDKAASATYFTGRAIGILMRLFRVCVDIGIL